ncbi:hypothetical protein MMC14_010249 [Varicellaria rhodocarpa]|nr:hypothetical protein [Varicellaria rhodocarpa]
MQLLDLPTELLALIPQHLSCLQDHYNLIRTCRAVYHNCAFVRSPLPPVDPNSHDPPPFLPRPRLLLAGVARQIADWVIQSESNRSQLNDALLRGNEGLLDLASHVTRITLEDARALYDARSRVITPIAQRLEQALCVVPHKSPEDEMWRSSGFDAEEALLDYWIYCELFHHSIDASWQRRSSLEPVLPLSPALRGRWMTNCVFGDGLHKVPRSKTFRTNKALIALLGCETWKDGIAVLRNFWSDGNARVAPEIGEEKATYMFLNIGKHLGKDSLELLLPGGLETVRGKFEGLRSSICHLETVEEPEWVCMMFDF